MLEQFILSRHAKERMHQRGLSKRVVEKTLNHGDIEYREDGTMSVSKYFKQKGTVTVICTTQMLLLTAYASTNFPPGGKNFRKKD